MLKVSEVLGSENFFWRFSMIFISTFGKKWGGVMVILVGGFSLVVCLWLYLWLPILGCSAERISALHGQRAVKRTTKCCNLQRLVLADQNIPGLLSLGTITYYYRILPQSTRIILMIFTPVLPRRISPCWVTGPRWLRAFCVTIECSGTQWAVFQQVAPCGMALRIDWATWRLRMAQ